MFSGEENNNALSGAIRFAYDMKDVFSAATFFSRIADATFIARRLIHEVRRNLQ